MSSHKLKTKNKNKPSTSDGQSIKSPASVTSIKRRRWIRKRRILLTFLSIYLSFLLALTIPTVQRSLIYLHWVRWPLNADFSTPENYGLAPFKTRNIQLTTSDNVTLGAWHILPHSIYLTSSQTFPPLHPLSEEVFDEAIRRRPTIILFHGNAASRAQSTRIRSYIDYSTRLDCNVLAIDYRGFADSSLPNTSTTTLFSFSALGLTPDEEGVRIDARTAWEWVVERRVGIMGGGGRGRLNKNGREESSSISGGVDEDEIDKVLGLRDGLGIEAEAKVAEEGIILVGHSLGTGVVSALAGELADRGISPRALVLIAPFTSLPELVLTYRLGPLPMLSVFEWVPWVQRLLLGFLVEKWNSSASLVKTSCPILILHALNDHDIPSSHSANLFNVLTAGNDNKDLVSTYRKGWGTINKSLPSPPPPPRREVTWFEAEAGGHNHVGLGEGVVELMKEVIGL